MTQQGIVEANFSNNSAASFDAEEVYWGIYSEPIQGQRHLDNLIVGAPAAGGAPGWNVLVAAAPLIL